MSNPDLALAESVSTTNASYFIFVYILVLIYCCFGLAVVCDVYFVPALQKLSYTYDLPPDIAGSTLMALGASVPELFASLIGVFITKDDIGTGSIIGSSCFNLIAVPAACAFVASATYTKKLNISPMPVIRNSAFYAVTILVLLLIIKDNKVDILEAIILLLFFVMYMAFMIFRAQSKNSSDSIQNSLTSSYISSTDSAIAECCETISSRSSSSIKRNNNKQVSREQQYQNNYQQHHVYGQFYFSDPSNFNTSSTTVVNIAGKNDYNAISERTPLVKAAKVAEATKKSNQLLQQEQQRFSSNNYNQSYLNYNQQQVDLNDNSVVSLDLGLPVKNSTCLAKNVVPVENHFPSLNNAIKGEKVSNNFDNSNRNQQLEHDENWVSSNWILLPMLPLTLSMKVLTPCKFKNTCWTIWTFLVSIALIGGLTYISVWMVHLFGQTVGIPETIAGMTILSWGTGVPELIASIVLIKKTAQADMAICNTIGSNVIDISFCLSVPWIVKCVLSQVEGNKPFVEIQSAALPWTSFTLLLSVLLLIMILKIHNWELGFSVGIWLSVVYITFVVFATFLEYSYAESGLDLFAL